MVDILNEEKTMRYLTQTLKTDLKKKAVFLSGPRQVGKSTEAKELVAGEGRYYNWDIAEDRRSIREQSWPRQVPLVVLDELHKMPKWKNYLKGVIDDQGNRPALLITSSARLETFRKAGDALTGRSFHYHLHPIDIKESKTFSPLLSAHERVEHLVQTGGFPESYLQPNDSKRLLIDRLNYVLREDLRDIHNTKYLRVMEILLDLLRERVGKGLNYAKLAQDIGVSAPTIKVWIGLLERLYLIFLVKPYSRNISQALRKEPRAYFFDCSAALDDLGARLENLVACCLLKFCDFQRDVNGREMSLHYFRDKDGHEVDFVVTENRKIIYACEVKASDDNLHNGLYYFSKLVQVEKSVQLVKDIRRAKEVKGISIEPLGDWLEKL
jgi:predicted AAA+ superfamily ATPase